jgi:hypothetical protein
VPWRDSEGECNVPGDLREKENTVFPDKTPDQTGSNITTEYTRVVFHLPAIMQRA